MKKLKVHYKGPKRPSAAPKLPRLSDYKKQVPKGGLLNPGLRKGKRVGPGIKMQKEVLKMGAKASKAAKKAWKTRKSRYGKTGLHKSHRAKKQLQSYVGR